MKCTVNPYGPAASRVVAFLGATRQLPSQGTCLPRQWLFANKPNFSAFLQVEKCSRRAELSEVPCPQRRASASDADLRCNFIVQKTVSEPLYVAPQLVHTKRSLCKFTEIWTIQMQIWPGLAGKFSPVPASKTKIPTPASPPMSLRRSRQTRGRTEPWRALNTQRVGRGTPGLS